jgi:hypothetical protein
VSDTRSVRCARVRTLTRDTACSRKCGIDLEVPAVLLPRYRAPWPWLGYVAAAPRARGVGRARCVHRQPRRRRRTRSWRPGRRHRLRPGVARLRRRKRKRGARLPLRRPVVEHDSAGRLCPALVDLDRIASRLAVVRDHGASAAAGRGRLPSLHTRCFFSSVIWACLVCVLPCSSSVSQESSSCPQTEYPSRS